MYGGRLRTDQTSMFTSLNWIVLSKRTPHTNGFIAYITVCQYYLSLLGSYANRALMVVHLFSLPENIIIHMRFKAQIS